MSPGSCGVLHRWAGPPLELLSFEKVVMMMMMMMMIVAELRGHEEGGGKERMPCQ
jgi:hypothetical protein